MAICKKMVIFLLGGFAYVALELLWRGRSHISMFLAGGTCLLLIGSMEEHERKLPLPLRILAGAGIITLVELGVGLGANRDYRVWDYRNMPGNFRGQICPQFCLLWVPISGAAIWLYDRVKRLVKL